MLKEDELRISVMKYIRHYGSTIQFIATSLGVSREHLSRWLHDKNYVISSKLKNKINGFMKEK